MVADGFTALKLGVPPQCCRERCRRGARAGDGRARVEAVRQAVGDDVDLMLDNHHGQLPPGDAIELCRALAPFILLRRPVPPDTPDALAKGGPLPRLPVVSQPVSVCLRSGIIGQS